SNVVPNVFANSAVFLSAGANVFVSILEAASDANSTAINPAAAGPNAFAPALAADANPDKALPAAVPAAFAPESLNASVAESTNVFLISSLAPDLDSCCDVFFKLSEAARLIDSLASFIKSSVSSASLEVPDFIRAARCACALASASSLPA